jgi:hypothetical protein
MSNGLKKPKPVPKPAIKVPDTASRHAETTKSILKLAEETNNEHRDGTKRTKRSK